MQASTIEKATAYLRPQFNSVKAKQQKDAMKPRIFTFTAEDLHDYLHQKSGKVETINLEESRSKKLEENGMAVKKQSSCKFISICFKFLFACLSV